MSGAITLNFAVLAQPVRDIWSRVQICNIYKMADCSRPEIDSDIMSGRIEDGVETNLCANFGDPASSGTFLFPPARPSSRYDNTRSRSYASSSGNYVFLLFPVTATRKKNYGARAFHSISCAFCFKIACLFLSSL